MLETEATHYSQLPLPPSGFKIDGRVYTASDVVSLLENIITEERKQRIAQVIHSRTDNFVPVVENIFDRGNINAVMRSAEAFGFYNFHIVEKDLAQHKESNRITKGTHKWLNIHKHKSATNAVEYFKSKGIKVYCTHLDSSQPMSEVDFSEPTALVFGNERDGVSKEMQGLADGNCIIPMKGFAQSFNISVAAAISFYHVHLQRSHHFGKSGDLSEEKKQWLTANYYLKTFGSVEKFKKLCQKNYQVQML